MTTEKLKEYNEKIDKINSLNNKLDRINLIKLRFNQNSLSNLFVSFNAKNSYEGIERYDFSVNTDELETFRILFNAFLDSTINKLQKEFNEVSI